MASDLKKVDYKGYAWLTEHLNMRLLKWMSIAVPILFLVIVDILRHTFLFTELHNIPGFLFTYSIMASGVILFSYTIFRLIDGLQSRVNEQNRWLSAVNAIAVAASQKLRLEDLLETGLNQVMKIMKADACIICLIDTEKEEHSAVCHRGLSSETVRGIQRAKLKDDPIAGEVFRTGRPVILERIFEDPRVAELARKEGIRSAISVPLKYEGDVNGILAVATRESRRFSYNDKQFLESVGGQLGMAIRNAVLYEQTELQNRELGALLEVGKVVTSSFDPEELLASSLDTILKVTHADAAEIWLMEGNEEIAMRCHRGANREAFLERNQFHMGEGLPGMAAQSKIPIVVHDLPSDTSFLRQRVKEVGYHTFCALPFRYKGKLVGVLAVAALSPDAFSRAQELRLLEGIGEWLALSLENAHLYQQVQEVAIVRERERIAREMHDGMAQLLGYINTQTIGVRRMLSNGRLDEAREELTKMEDITRDLYADVREGILGLRIAAHQRDGIMAALRKYVEQYTEMSGIRVDFKVSEDAEQARVPPSAEIQLIRIVQEALTNVRKHARATAIDVAFQRKDNNILVTITDNGQGFDMTHLPSTGWPRFGLQTLRERAEAVGGFLSINTAPGQGTRVEVLMPVSL